MDVPGLGDGPIAPKSITEPTGDSELISCRFDLIATVLLCKLIAYLPQ